MAGSGWVWLGAQGQRLGWSTQTVPEIHLLRMAVLTGLARLDLIPHQPPPMAGRSLPLVMVLAGGLPFGMEQPLAIGVVGMILLPLAWALAVPDHGPTRQALIRHQPMRWTPMGGPALLITVGTWIPAMGPQALALAYGGLAALAGVTLLALFARHPSIPIHAHPREEAS